MLSAAGLDHVVLNAHHDREEAAIVTQAGLPGRITVATNMAGRAERTSNSATASRQPAAFTSCSPNSTSWRELTGN